MLLRFIQNRAMQKRRKSLRRGNSTAGRLQFRTCRAANRDFWIAFCCAARYNAKQKNNNRRTHMEKRFQIVTDSSCDLPQALADELDLAVLPGAEGPRVLAPYAAGLEQRVELARPAGRPVVGHHALHGDPEALVERDRPPREGAGRLLPLVGQLLGVGDPAVVVDGHVQARRPGAPPRPAAAPEGPVPASLRYARHLPYVDVEQLPRGARARSARA